MYSMRSRMCKVTSTIGTLLHGGYVKVPYYNSTRGNEYTYPTQRFQVFKMFWRLGKKSSVLVWEFVDHTSESWICFRNHTSKFNESEKAGSSMFLICFFQKSVGVWPLKLFSEHGIGKPLDLYFAHHYGWGARSYLLDYTNCWKLFLYILFLTQKNVKNTQQRGPLHFTVIFPL